MATLQAKTKWCIEESSFFAFHKSLPKKADTTVRVFDHGEFYSVHEKDAFIGANIVFSSHASVKNVVHKSKIACMFKFVRCC